MSETAGNEPRWQVPEGPVYSNQQLAHRGVGVERLISPNTIGIALGSLQEAFGESTVVPVLPDNPEILPRLTVIGRRESARAIIDASRQGEVISTSTVAEALEEQFPKDLRRRLTSYSSTFQVDDRPSRRGGRLVSLHMTSNAFPATRKAGTDIIDQVTGLPYDWEYRPALVPIGRLLVMSLIADVRVFTPERPLPMRFSAVNIDNNRRSPH